MPRLCLMLEQDIQAGVLASWELVKTSLAAIAGIRALVLEVLTNATDADWDQVSQHPELGPVTLSELFEKADDHIVGHTQQLREIAANF